MGTFITAYSGLLAGTTRRKDVVRRRMIGISTYSAPNIEIAANDLNARLDRISNIDRVILSAIDLPKEERQDYRRLLDNAKGNPYIFTLGLYAFAFYDHRFPPDTDEMDLFGHLYFWFISSNNRRNAIRHFRNHVLHHEGFVPFPKLAYAVLRIPHLLILPKPTIRTINQKRRPTRPTAGLRLVSGH